MQALVRWDPVWHARGQLEERAEVGFPPAVHLAAIDGTVASIGEILELAALPDSAEVLGPVPLPPGERLPFSSDEPEHEDVERMLVRVPRADGRALAKALAEARAVRSARRSVGPVRVQVDPLRIG